MKSDFPTLWREYLIIQIWFLIASSVLADGTSTLKLEFFWEVCF